MSYLKQNRIPAWVDNSYIQGWTVVYETDGHRGWKNIAKAPDMLKKLKIKQREDREANTERKQ